MRPRRVWGDVNRTSVALTGQHMYPGPEPGGGAMFAFMVAAMRAGDAGQVPQIGDVEEELLGRRGTLAAAAEAQT